jgi:hypothetical protein
MFNMAHAFTVSLRRNGGAYKDAPVILTVGEDEYAPELTDGSIAWLEKENVSIRLVPKFMYASRKYFGTGAYRMMADFQADVVLMVDSDILIKQPLDDLVESIAATGEFGALIEFGTPFYFENSTTWEELYAHCGLGEPKLIYQYTGWGLMGQELKHQFCPPWFNFGVVIAPRDVMIRIGRVFFPLVERIEELEESMYRAQLALSLAVVALDIPYRVLPLRYKPATPKRLKTPRCCTTHGRPTSSTNGSTFRTWTACTPPFVATAITASWLKSATCSSPSTQPWSTSSEVSATSHSGTARSGPR